MKPQDRRRVLEDPAFRKAYIRARLTEEGLVFAPNTCIEVNGDPAKMFPSTHGFLTGISDGGPPDTVESLRDDYVRGRIEIEEFERRVGELLADA